MIVNPVLRIFFAIRSFSEFPNDDWDLKSTLWFYVTHSIEAMLVAYGVVVADAFFRRKRSLPLLFQAYVTTAVIGAVAGQTLNCLLLESDYDLKGLGRQVLVSLIWMSYFQRSRRVEATFVN